VAARLVDISMAGLGLEIEEAAGGGLAPEAHLHVRFALERDAPGMELGFRPRRVEEREKGAMLGGVFESVDYQDSLALFQLLAR
jgi:hypothetical protein